MLLWCPSLLDSKTKNTAVTLRLCILAYRCLHGTAPTYLAGSLLRTSNVDTRHRLRSADSVTQPCWWYRPPDVQRSATVPFQWPRHVRGTACRHLSGMHRRWRRSVANWRQYFSGRHSTMVRRSWFYCTVCCCCLPATADCRRFCFCFVLYISVRCSCNVSDMIASP